ncbi:DUF3043 domain-containing protein [Virgisporangium ochraceum]|uniref:DUF3043 domain-containing protein n=1 Tax=Virgisporangium ochraceum TaxID=65505 RepID=A0A8J3ZTE7_9ACTN|nr:DUF3043 domain-containing protein [Virgisporangium ochraceum]GIJ68733.1 hypothetical protein Voc01_036500 [Virgisporangium ochraceum]
MPSLFKRKTVEETEPAVEVVEEVRPKGRTLSKRELGQETKKRPSANPRSAATAPPADRKEALKRSREKAREDRAERRAAMMAGDDRYLLPRDKGPERAMVRDVVDRRLTIGTWFFGGALIVLIGSSAAMPPLVQAVSNVLWALLALGTLVDSILLGREVKRRMREQFPKSTQKLTSLYLYASMRGLTFRRLRVPKPRVKIGQKLD